MTARGCSYVAGLCLCLWFAPPMRAGLASIWPFEMLAQAPVIATCMVQTTSVISPPTSADQRDVLGARAVLIVLRSFPPSELAPGERIVLAYEAAGKYDSGINETAPRLKPGDNFAFPLKRHSAVLSAPWRLIGDDGLWLVIPAIARNPQFAEPPTSGRDFLLSEIASGLIAGTRQEMLAEASYLNRQRAIVPDLLKLLESSLKPDDDQWARIAAALFSSMGVPRPSVEDLRAGKDTNGGDGYSGSLVTRVLQKLGPSQPAKEALIHHLLENSDIASWSVAVTLREFAQEPSLIRELRAMLAARSPGALEIAHAVLATGQREIWPEALGLSFHYLAMRDANPSELQEACWTIGDFGTDEQFGRLLQEVRSSQYRDQRHYDQLWPNLIWPESHRERPVLEILLKDDRPYANARYSDVARAELNRIQQSGR
jgi:hypothetical protein